MVVSEASSSTIPENMPLVREPVRIIASGCYHGLCLSVCNYNLARAPCCRGPELLFFRNFYNESSDIVSSPSSSNLMEDRLILTIDFETPPPAAELGDVLAAIARDYREMTRGRFLVVISVEIASITATLTDAALAAAPYAAGSIAVIAGI